MRKINILAFLLITLLMSTSCEEDNSKELIDYYNTKLKVAFDNTAKAKKLYKKVSIENYKDNETVLKAITKNILPSLEDTVDKLSIVKPVSNEIIRLNDEYIEILKKYISAYRLILHSVNNDVRKDMVRAYEILFQTDRKMKEWQVDLEKYAVSQGITIEK